MSAEKAQLIQEIAAEIGLLCAEKNKSYGDSFVTSGQIMALLYPHGIQPDQMRDALGVVRVLDKLSRIAHRKDAFGESPWRDLAGYGIVGAAADEGAPIPFFPSPPSLPKESRGTDPETRRKTFSALSPTSLAPKSTNVDNAEKLTNEYTVTCYWGEGRHNGCTTFRDTLPEALDAFRSFIRGSYPHDAKPLEAMPHTVWIQKNGRIIERWEDPYTTSLERGS